MRKTRWRRHAAALCAIALAASACGNGDDDGGIAADDGNGNGNGAEEIATDVGVTDEPCENAVNEDNGCIYLGVLSDLTVGPFAPLGVQIVEGQRAFWQRVNDEGGIAGYDIDIDTYTRDNEYNPQVHSQLYNEIEPDILALAQTLGTPPTEAILPDMDADDVVGIPASWWSGWNFEESDHGVILESGYSYCLESQIGLDWANDNEGEIGSVQAVGYPGDYGGDSAAGVAAWAEATGAEDLGFAETGPNALVGSQDAAVQQVVSAGADVVVLATGPAETAEIVGGAVAAGFEGRFLGSVPTWNPALMDSPAAPALEAVFTHIGPWEAFTGSSEAHQAMQAALGEGNLPANDGFTFGWIWSYPMKALLEQAAENGDLTRSGVRAAVDGLVVDYEGSLPERTFGEAGEDVRTAVISKPDASEELNLRTEETGVTGPTADAFAYETRCSG
ncbi:ABC transporter substrate-binding protein [Nitriliruptor alkaliphilus]|uniref:ABC transporter substrate-binding protein n=1 Tax=Nitriliruptor alkaliphilus TaxID=427918 RepID=UPI0006973B36|nr:ABC transporter substrate-binding protein [Nitriliruptor alkaliphilus]